MLAPKIEGCRSVLRDLDTSVYYNRKEHESIPAWAAWQQSGHRYVCGELCECGCESQALCRRCAIAGGVIKFTLLNLRSIY